MPWDPRLEGENWLTNRQRSCHCPYWPRHQGLSWNDGSCGSFRSCQAWECAVSARASRALMSELFPFLEGLEPEAQAWPGRVQASERSIDCF